MDKIQIIKIEDLKKLPLFYQYFEVVEVNSVNSAKFVNSENHNTKRKIVEYPYKIIL